MSGDTENFCEQFSASFIHIACWSVSVHFFEEIVFTVSDSC
jgi:hypothetical protein